MQIKVNIYITAAGATRAFLLRDEGGAFPEVIGVGRSLPAAISDYASCFNSIQERLPETERIHLSPSDILPSRRMVQRFVSVWHLLGCENGK